MKFKKQFGQNFLVDSFVAEEIAEFLPLKGKTVLEIGAGDGALTKELARVAKNVVTLEIDTSLVPKLKENLKEFENIEVKNVNALDFDFSDYDYIYGNLPYNISTPLLVKILESDFKHAVVMLQLEVADRIISPPGSDNFGRLSVLVQNNANCEIVQTVPAEAFNPVPKVDSAVIHLEKKAKKDVKKLNQKLVDAIFQHKNQTVQNSLIHSRHHFDLDKKQARDLDLGELGAKRPRELTLDELEFLSKNLPVALRAKK